MSWFSKPKAKEPTPISDALVEAQRLLGHHIVDGQNLSAHGGVLLIAETLKELAARVVALESAK